MAGVNVGAGKGRHTPDAIRQRGAIFHFQKQINRSTIENFGRYENYTTLAVEML